MFTSILILTLFLPVAILPLALDTFFSHKDLNEMGICLENSDDTFPMQGYELVGFLPTSNNCNDPDVCVGDQRATSNLSMTCPLDQWKTPPLAGEFLIC